MPPNYSVVLPRNSIRGGFWRAEALVETNLDNGQTCVVAKSGAFFQDTGDLIII